MRCPERHARPRLSTRSTDAFGGRAAHAQPDRAPGRRRPPLAAGAVPLRRAHQRLADGRLLERVAADAADDGGGGGGARQQARPRRQPVGADELGRGPRPARLRRRVRRAAARGRRPRRLPRRARAARPSRRADRAGRRRRDAGGGAARGARRGSALLVNISGHLRDPELLGALPAARVRRPRPRLHPGLAQPRATTSAWRATICTSPSAPTSAPATRPLPSCGLRWIRCASRWCSTAGRSRRPASTASPPSPAGAAPSARSSGRGAATASRRTSSAASRGVPEACGLPFQIALDLHPADAADRGRLAAGGWNLLPTRRGVDAPTDFAGYVRGSGAEFSVAQGVYVRHPQRLVQRPHRPLPGERPSGAGAGHRLWPDAAGGRGAARILARPSRPRGWPASWCETTPATGGRRASWPSGCSRPSAALAPLLEASGVAP